MSASESPSLSPSSSESPSPSPSESPSSSPSLSPSASESPSNSPSLSPSASESPSLSPSASESPSLSPSASESPSESASLSPSASESASESPSESPSVSPSSTVERGDRRITLSEMAGAYTFPEAVRIRSGFFMPGAANDVAILRENSASGKIVMPIKSTTGDTIPFYLGDAKMKLHLDYSASTLSSGSVIVFNLK